MRLFVLLFALSLTGCGHLHQSQDAPVARSDINFIATDAQKKSGYPFSSAVEADGWVFLSGSIGNVPGAGLVPGGIEAETRQMMDNIRATLARQNLGMDRIVKCTAMLADMAEWSTFNGIYKQYFDGTYPARSAFGASGLALGARVELECIARR